ncbi:MAG: 5-oxoprolinase subunit PxpB [Oscillospiraceae bacterium]|nr:5-oxoprolinase subunit PxpB [Oscillospiraceae bacterium]
MNRNLTLLPHGDRAVDLVFENRISPEVNAEVQAFCRAVIHTKPDGILGCIPAYRTLTVEYDPLRLTYGQVCLFLRSLSAPEAEEEGGILVRIPVCYGGEFGPDLGAVAKYAGFSEQEIIRRHTAPDYPVYMLGFRPGFPYLGGLDPLIACPRRAVPRQSVEGGSVGIAGGQTGVYPEASPGGWNIIGRTPLRLFDETSLSLLHPGDTVRFEAVSEDVFWAIAKRRRWER